MTTKQFRRYLDDREKGHQKQLAALEKKLDRRRQEIFNTIFKIFRPNQGVKTSGGLMKSTNDSH
jgi:hypothetical protein